MIANTWMLTGMDLALGKIESTVKTPKAIQIIKL